jgi:hypothetical protein
MKTRLLLSTAVAGFLSIQSAAAQNLPYEVQLRCFEQSNVLDRELCDTDERIAVVAPVEREPDKPHEGKPHFKKDHFKKKLVLWQWLHHNPQRERHDKQPGQPVSKESISGPGGALSRSPSSQSASDTHGGAVGSVAGVARDTASGVGETLGKALGALD